MNIVLLTNIMTPYRRFFYDCLYEELKKRQIDFYVIIMAETEPNRNWEYNEYRTDYSILLKGQTITISGTFIHINWGLKKVYKKLKPDVVICAGSYMYPSLWKTLKYKKQYGYKVYYWSESHLNEVRTYGRIKIKIREFIRKAIIGKFDGFWYAGQFSKEFIDCYAKTNSDYIFVPNLVDNQFFDQINLYSDLEKSKIKKKYSLPNGKRILMTPARLSPVKGIIEFLKLLSMSNEKKDVIYIIAGDGELKENIEKFCKENDLDVMLVGYKTDRDMLDLYAITDIFVLPSLSDPNPLSCIEACWCSLPLLVSEHVGNYPEIIDEGKNGYVFSYSNEQDAIRKIDCIISANEKWLESAGKISKNIAKVSYNPELAVNRIITEIILDRGVNNE